MTTGWPFKFIAWQATSCIGLLPSYYVCHAHLCHGSYRDGYKVVGRGMEDIILTALYKISRTEVGHLWLGYGTLSDSTAG